MKQILLLALTFLSLSVFAQTCPTTTGNSIIIKSNYTVGSSIANESNAILCYNNTTTSKITAMQFRLTYDTIAFTNPSVYLLTADSANHYVQFYVNKGTITITSVYNGSNLNYTYPSGELIRVNFKHSSPSTFQYLTSIQPLASK